MAAATPGVSVPSDGEVQRMVGEVAADGRRMTIDDFAALLKTLGLPAMGEGAVAASS